jgi:hypothetical protein
MPAFNPNLRHIGPMTFMEAMAEHLEEVAIRMIARQAWLDRDWAEKVSANANL